MLLAKIVPTFIALLAASPWQDYAPTWKGKPLEEKQIAANYGKSVLVEVVPAPRSHLMAWVPARNIKSRSIGGRKALLTKTNEGFGFEVDLKGVGDSRTWDYLYDILHGSYFGENLPFSYVTCMRVGNKGVLLSGEKAYRDSVLAALKKRHGKAFKQF